ncbi:MAG: hypothetical protein AAGC68_17220, partial [Verrucomicrobiota bacterium]
MKHLELACIVGILSLGILESYSGPLEDALDGGAGTFGTAGTGNWGATSFPTNDGVDAAVGPRINAGQESDIFVDVDGPGIMAFWWKVESEFSGGETFVAANNGTGDFESIGPFTDFLPGSVRVAPGANQRVFWKYIQAVSPGSSIQNRAWLDEVYYFAYVQACEAGRIVKFVI